MKLFNKFWRKQEVGSKLLTWIKTRLWDCPQCSLKCKAGKMAGGADLPELMHLGTLASLGLWEGIHPGRSLLWKLQTWPNLRPVLRSLAMSSPSLASEQVTFGVNLLPIGSVGAGQVTEVRGEARNLVYRQEDGSRKIWNLSIETIRCKKSHETKLTNQRSRWLVMPANIASFSNPVCHCWKPFSWTSLCSRDRKSIPPARD